MGQSLERPRSFLFICLLSVIQSLSNFSYSFQKNTDKIAKSRKIQLLFLIQKVKETVFPEKYQRSNYKLTIK